MKFLFMTLVLIGFEIQENLAEWPMPPPPPVRDCWDGNKCRRDQHCGEKGMCLHDTQETMGHEG